MPFRGTEVGYVEIQNMLQSLRDDQKKLEEDIAAASVPSVGGTTTRRQYIRPGWDFTHTEGTGSISTANVIRCYRFRLYDTYTNIESISTWQTAFNALGRYGIWAIYSGDGTELLCQFPEIQGLPGGSTGLTTSPLLASPITLEPADYWLAWSQAVDFQTAYNGPVVAWQAVVDAAEIILGQAQFPMLNTAPPFFFPPILGTITMPASIGIPLVQINCSLPS